MPKFTCDANAYQVFVPEGSPPGTNSTFIKMDTATGNFTTISNDLGFNINAIGYNTLDDFIYGIYKDTANNVFNLVRVHSNGLVNDLGPLNGVPSNGGINCGCFDDQGFYYIKKANQPEFYVLDLRPMSSTFQQFVDSTNAYSVIAAPPFEIPYSPSTLTEGDWTYNLNDGLLYAGEDSVSGSLLAINPTTGTLTNPTILTPGFPTTYGGMFSDANGFIYGIDNDTGRVVRWTVQSGGLSAQNLTTATPTSSNDACSCVKAAILFDFGDAPDTGPGNGPNNYNTLLDSNGPKHGNNNNLRLGSTITLEMDALQNPTATGDVDDGAIGPIVVREGSTSFTLDVLYTNNTGNNAYIYAWLDYKRDGIFSGDEADSRTPFVVSSAPNERRHSLIFPLPKTSTLAFGRNSFIRIRITSQLLTNANSSNLLLEDTRSIGSAADGEVEDYELRVTNSPAFECSRFAYRVWAVNSGSNSVLEKIDTVTGAVETISFNIGFNVNAIGYNTIDNYLYGTTKIDDDFYLVRISSDGTVVNLGKLNGLPGNLTAINVGTCDDNGYFYFKQARGSASDQFFVLNVNPNAPNYLRYVDPTSGYIPAADGFSTPITPALETSGDWSFRLSDGLLYSANGPETGLMTIDPTTGAAANLTLANANVTDFGYGGCFTDANGFFYGISNSTGMIYRWKDVGGGVMSGEAFSQSTPSDSTDAAFCLSAPILVDFGDCPDNGSGTQTTNNYNTLLINNGPRHGISENLLLGQKVTSENDARQNADATGDDLTAGVQDDGISPVPPIYVGAKTYEVPIIFTNSTGRDAQIYGWVDFNRNGVFEINEGAIVSAPSGSANSAQITTLKFTIPSTTNLVNGDTTFIRTRITTDGLINNGAFPTSEDSRSLGPASNGEVEDYIINVIALQITGVIWYDSNCNGLLEAGEPLAENVVVELYEYDDLKNPIASTTTNSSGVYTFNNLMPGRYVIKVIPPFGVYGFTASGVGTNPAINSNVNPTTGISDIIIIDENTTIATANAGFCRKNKVSGTVFYDCQKNGVLEFKNALLCGVTVNLLDSNNNIIESTETDCDGNYTFEKVSFGNYNVQFIAPPGFVFSTIPNPATFYSSKPNPTNGIASISVNNMDVLNVFAGLYGSLSMDLKYCSNSNDCSCNPDLNCNQNGYNPNLGTGCTYCR